MRLFLYAFAAIFTAFVIGSTIFYHDAPAQAAAPAAGPLCEPIGIVGNVIISRCEDEDTGAIIYANSAGYMLLGE